jgi:hypothetical protein
MVRTLFALVLPVLVCCGPPVPAPAGGSAAAKISFEPSAESTAVSSVVRVHVASASLSAGDVSLFQGDLSTYYLARIKSGELPATLVARQIPVVSWRGKGELILAPVRPLALGEYSVASSSGSLGQFQVTTALPLLTRLWPPAGSVAGLQHVVYCGDGSVPLSMDTLLLEPGEISITPLAGADESGLFATRCLHFEGDVELSPDQLVVPPPTSGAWALDPAPFSGLAEPPATALSCTDGEVTLGLGCAAVADDRVTVHTPEGALLWSVNTEHGSLLEVTEASSFVIRGLSPETSQHLWGSVYDVSGAELDFDTTVDMGAARERPVLNEELANPLGPEPQSEWLELVNDGRIALDLSHFALRDSGGSMPLPSETLAVGEYALLVRDDFAPSASDVPPAPGARLIRVPQLGTSGLSNSGESLALIDANSVVISALPAVAAKAGQSLARRHSWSLDDDPSAFSTGTPTPGTPND